MSIDLHLKTPTNILINSPVVTIRLTSVRLGGGRARVGVILSERDAHGAECGCEKDECLHFCILGIRYKKKKAAEVIR